MRDSFSRLGFGCARIGSFNNPMTTSATNRFLTQALDFGVTLFDTADVYGQGDSERALGELLRDRRDAAVVVTKVGQRFPARARIFRPLKRVIKPLISRSARVRAGVSAQRPTKLATDFSPRYLRLAIEASLRRLRTETIDALLLHSPLAADLRDGRPFEALECAKEQGKVRCIGVACDDVDAVRMALVWPGVQMIEIAPPVFQAAAIEIRQAVVARGLHVLLREAIRYRGSATPMNAVVAAARDPVVSSVIVGTNSPTHLGELSRAVLMPGTTSSAFQRVLDARTDIAGRGGSCLALERGPASKQAVIAS